MLATRTLALLLAVFSVSAYAQSGTSDYGLGATAESIASDPYRSLAEVERAAAATKPPEPVIKLPELDNWTRSELRALPPEDQGFTVAYDHSSGVTVTLYQFTRGMREIPDDLRSEPVQNEMKLAKSGIAQAVHFGMWRSAEETESGVVRLGESAKQALWSRQILIGHGEELTSETFVWSHNNAFFKIRSTSRTRYVDVEAEARAQFELLTALGNACGAPLPMR